ncbi:hypothetical protein B0T17DRAFT_545391 [Bombardia bombarda]|uniref:Uncharacterized protein n=1 Tax=Bombardia bombarda TaxID=252184 RepID=A0AA39W3W5_9PEZI|nr:hypothetical protein B0T17DRAFT_545391 [Bombardia bombarda]
MLMLMLARRNCGSGRRDDKTSGVARVFKSLNEAGPPRPWTNGVPEYRNTCRHGPQTGVALRNVWWGRLRRGRS